MDYAQTPKKLLGARIDLFDGWYFGPPFDNGSRYLFRPERTMVALFGEGEASAFATMIRARVPAPPNEST